MKLILIKLLKSDSKCNEELLNILSKSLVDIIKQGYKYDFTFARGDGQTKYPIMVLDGKPYSGLVQIKTGVSTVIKQYQAQQMKQKLNDEDIHAFQMDKLMDSDSESEGGDDNNASDIQAKMNKFNKRRESQKKTKDKSTNNRVINHVDSDAESDGGPKLVKSSKKKKTKKQSHKKPNSGGGKQKVVERMRDDDIGGAFEDLGGNKEDNMFLENMFAGQQETDLSVLDP